MVTGGASRIGFETMRVLARRGARMIGLARDAADVRRVRDFT